MFAKNGVPIDAIIGEDKSRHTRDNAFLSRKAVDESGIDIQTASHFASKQITMTLYPKDKCHRDKD